MLYGYNKYINRYGLSKTRRGETMPELTKCVRHNGKTYCWDRESGTVVEIKITDVPFDKVPEDVLAAMLNKQGRETE